MADSRCESDGRSLTARRLEDFGTLETRALYAAARRMSVTTFVSPGRAIRHLPLP